MIKKKNIILISIIIIFIIILFIFSFTNKPKEKANENIPKEEIKKEKKQGEQKEKETKKEETKEIIKEESKEIIKEEVEQTKEVEEKQPSPTPPPQKQPIAYYVCPNGYVLNNDKCISIIQASYTCPPNTNDYSNDNIPRDKYCVNLSDGYDTDIDNCQTGYGSIQVLTIGSQPKYRCLKLYDKIYTCPTDYNLQGTNCIKTINAEIKYK